MAATPEFRHKGCAQPAVFPLLVLVSLFATCSPAASCQERSAPAIASVPAASQPSPTYAVATIRPPAPGGYAMPLRVYIQAAYGIPVNSKGYVIGPEWVDTASYDIQAKPDEATEQALHAMTPQQRDAATQHMQQSLLADRFKLQAHFETRDMPIYRLVVAQGGPRLTADPDPTKGMAVVGRGVFRGTALPMHQFVNLLEAVPDLDHRLVEDHTSLAGNYDFKLRWTPLSTQMNASTNTVASSTDAPAADAEAPSFFTAIEDQLGLKLIPARGPGRVLVIDHIERPTPN